MDKKNGIPGWSVAFMVLALAGIACSLVSGLPSTGTPLSPTRKATFTPPSQATVVKATQIPPTAGSTAVFTEVAPRPHPQAQGLSMGDPQALVVVVAYGDFQCGPCGNYSQVFEPNIILLYIATGKVYYTFVPFSFLDEQSGAVGNESKHAAEAAYCASEQDKFWEYHDLLLANQAPENSGGFGDDRLAAMAASIDLNVTQFSACYTAHKYQQRVLQDETASYNAGITQVPSFMVNGKLVNLPDLTVAIDAAYKAKGGE